jgi:hypothetical protein
MIPNIGDALLHKGLKRDFNIHLQAPKNLLDQWHIFKAIASHNNSTWGVELLFFPAKWIQKAKMDSAWHELYLFLLEYAWVSSAYERNQLFYSFALSCVLANRNLKPNPYMLDTARHLLSTILGSTPGFRPAIDESMGPIKLIQDAYVSSYGLKKYLPTLMHPAHFSLQNLDSDPVYYSLQLPTTVNFSPKARKLPNTLLDLRELRYIMEVFFDEIKNNTVQLDSTIIGQIPQKIAISYFHNKPDIHHEISLSDKLAHTDKNLNFSLNKNAAKKFADNGAFIRGCVQIKHRNNSLKSEKK